MEGITVAQPTTQSPTSQGTDGRGVAPRVITLPPPPVFQSTLAQVLRLRRELKAAEQAVRAQKDALADRERAVIQALENGAAVSTGILTADVRYEERRNMAWRKVAEEYLGPDFCQLVVEETPPTVYPRLVIA